MLINRLLFLFVLILAGTSLQAQLPVGYSWARPIVLNNPNATSIPNIQVEFDLGTDVLVTAGKMQADGDDIAFMDECSELYYWIEDSSFNTTRTTFWVKIPLLPPGTHTIYMYYGDPVATANPYRSGDNTFVFFDDFNTGATPDLTKWSLVSNNGGDVHPQTPQGHYAPSAAVYGNSSVGVSHPMTAGDYEIGSKIQLAVNNALVDFDPEVGWFQSPVLNVNRIATWYNDDEFPRDYTTTAAGATVYNLSTQPIRGRWSYPRIRTIGNQVSTRRFSHSPTYFNEFGPTATFTPANVTNLYMGSSAFQGIPAKYDFIFVRNAVANEPTLQLQAELPNPWLAFAGYTVTANGPICPGDTLFLSVTSIPGAVYAWTGPGNFTGSQTQEVVLNALTGTYTAVASLYGACIADSAVVQSVVFLTLPDDTLLCTSATITPGGPPMPGVIYEWTSLPAGFVSASSDPTITPTVTTTYFLTQTSASGACTYYDTITVTVGPQPIAAFTASVAEGQAEVQFTNQSQYADYYNWILGDGNFSGDTDPLYVYSSSGEYTVGLIATAENGCADTAWQIVSIDLSSVMYIPNAFTPNNDGLNDVFSVSSYNMASMEVMIFDRWGELIAKWSTLNGSWDGRMNGNLCQIDVYVYVVHAVGLNGFEYNRHGHVSLVR
ncbi:MAG TPA: DUF2341 domain-containing protein [Bacteroidia bacterium]|nr:DUF2341 domain-containing protein [Bacteroidia bacterium]